MKAVLDIPRTAMEVFNMLPEGTLCEVIDNALYMSPSPTTDHQRILGNLFTQINYFLIHNTAGEAFVAPCDVYLDEGHSVVQPDILFVSKVNANLITKRGIIGPPDMVLEILSSNKSYDKETKFELYERNGISEYIIVDAYTKEVWHYLLINGKYQLQSVLLPNQLVIQQLPLTLSL
jgi:Uma2 family endonuclease